MVLCLHIMRCNGDEVLLTCCRIIDTVAVGESNVTRREAADYFSYVGGAGYVSPCWVELRYR